MTDHDLSRDALVKLVGHLRDRIRLLKSKVSQLSRQAYETKYSLSAAQGRIMNLEGRIETFERYFDAFARHQQFLVENDIPIFWNHEDRDLITTIVGDYLIEIHHNDSWWWWTIQDRKQPGRDLDYSLRWSTTHETLTAATSAALEALNHDFLRGEFAR